MQSRKAVWGHWNDLYIDLMLENVMELLLPFEQQYIATEFLGDAYWKIEWMLSLSISYFQNDSDMCVYVHVCVCICVI